MKNGYNFAIILNRDFLFSQRATTLCKGGFVCSSYAYNNGVFCEKRGVYMSMNSLGDIWKAVLDVLGQQLTPTAISTWFDDCVPVEIDGSTLVLKTSTDFKRDIIVKRFSETIKNTLSDIFSTDFSIIVLTEEELGDYQEKKKDDDPLPEMAGYTFDRFIVGNSNRFAHNAAVAVSQKPGSAYNPLFIYGNSGLGKTHLMHSIAHFILRNNPNAKIRYVTSETFINEFVDSIRNKNNMSPADFRNRYRELDVLLIDDIQFIIGKEGTQEEFFHTFNTLYENKKQIVIASDKPPKDIDNLEDRLRSRFEVGLIVDIQMPDFETRMAILRKKEELMNVNIDNEIIKYIATNIKSNIRELEGALTKIVAMSRLKGQSIDLALAEDLLKDHITPDGPKEVTPELIITTVAEHFGITNLEIASQKKSKEIVYPRQLAMYLCRTMTEAPLKTIGEYLGGRDHTTIMHGIDKISTELRTNEQLKSTIETLKKKISP